MGAFYYPANVSFAAQQMELLKGCSTAYSLDDILCKIVDHYNSIKQIGPAKGDSSPGKQHDGKDTKMKVDK